MKHKKLKKKLVRKTTLSFFCNSEKSVGEQKAQRKRHAMKTRAFAGKRREDEYEGVAGVL